ncbi:MAG TPA: hypothetical protein PLX14_10315 [Anaerolineales bacterium]|nr:hypothetical protein [Anaerolineales bacterium]
MKTIISNAVFVASKVNSRHLQVIWMFLALTMLVIGAGASEDVGGIGIR